MKPEGEAAYRHSGEERHSVFGVACGDTPPAFQVQKSIFYTMAYFVERLKETAMVAISRRWGKQLSMGKVELSWLFKARSSNDGGRGDSAQGSSSGPVPTGR